MQTKKEPKRLVIRVVLEITVYGRDSVTAEKEIRDFWGHSDNTDELSIALHNELTDRGLELDSCEIGLK